MEVLNSIKEIFAANVRTLRGNRTQREIAEALSLEVSEYQRYEAGVIPREPARQKALAAVYGIPVGRLFVDPQIVPEPTKDDVLRLARTALNVAEKLPLDLLERLSEMGPDDVAWLRGALTGRLPDDKGGGKGQKG